MSVFKKSKWIWISNELNKDEYGEFFTSFYCEGSNAECRISCDGDYTMFVNGNMVESNQYGDFEHYKIFDEIDISKYIKRGKNTLAVLVWHFGEDFQRYKTAQAGVIFEITSQEKLLLCSDEHVRARRSRTYACGRCKKITNQLGFSFLYDATKEDGWEYNGFSDGGFAVAVNKNCSFYLRPDSKLQRNEEKLSRVIKNGGNYYLVDLGEESVGLPSFELISSTVQKITVFWGEDLSNGHVRGIINDRNFSYEYVAKAGKNKFTNYMLRLGCRYLELYSENQIELLYLGIIPQTYPVKRKTFRIKGAVEQKIYDICVNTLQLSMMEHYVDTPWREQCLYVFDSRNQMLCGYYAFESGNTEYARSNLILLSKDKRSDGLLSICSPCGIDLTIPSFSLYYFIAVGEYLKYTKDATLIDEIYTKLISLTETFVGNMHNGLVYKFIGKNHWNFYDWSEYLEGKLFADEEYKPDLIINCLFVIALNNLRDILLAIGKEFTYEKILKEVKKSIEKAFYNKDKKAYSLTIGGLDFTVLGNSLAIIAGIANNPQESCGLITSGSFSEPSLSMKCFKYDALLITDSAKWTPYILDEIKRDYTVMLDCGATSVWETIDGAAAFDGAGSLCHGWSAMPAYYYHILYNK